MKRYVIYFILLVNLLILQNLWCKKTRTDDSSLYYPISTNNTWFYKGYKRKEKDKTYDIKASINKTEKIDGKNYYYFYAPELDIRYMIRKDKTGVYMKKNKYPFPITKLLIDIELIPELCILKFPLFKGKKWDYNGIAKIDMLGIFSIKREIKMKYEVLKKEKLTTAIGVLETYCIKLLIDKGDDKGFRMSKLWWSKNIGYVRSETTYHHVEITGCRIYSPKTKKYRCKGVLLDDK